MAMPLVQSVAILAKEWPKMQCWFPEPQILLKLFLEMPVRRIAFVFCVWMQRHKNTEEKTRRIINQFTQPWDKCINSFMMFRRFVFDSSGLKFVTIYVSSSSLGLLPTLRVRCFLAGSFQYRRDTTTCGWIGHWRAWRPRDASISEKTVKSN